MFPITSASPAGQMITAVTSSSASVHHRRAVIPSDACIAATSELAVGSVSPLQAKTFAQTPAQRHVAARAPGWPRSDQPWRAFQRGFRLLRTNTLRPRRTTTDPAFCFNALSEFLAFIVRRPFGPSSLLLQVVEGATIFLRPKFRPDRDPCDQSRRGELERCGLPPGGMPMEPLKHCARYRWSLVARLGAWRSALQESRYVV
jgi:hypothetical protein